MTMYLPVPVDTSRLNLSDIWNKSEKDNNLGLYVKVIRDSLHPKL